MMNEARIQQILHTMDIPSSRASDLSIRNVGWLLNNLFIRNGSHPDLFEVTELLREKMEELTGKEKSSLEI